MAYILKTMSPTENVPTLKTEAYFRDRQARGALVASQVFEFVPHACGLVSHECPTDKEKGPSGDARSLI